MRKLNLVAMSYDKDRILNALHRTNAAQITLHADAENTLPLSFADQTTQEYFAAVEAALQVLTDVVTARLTAKAESLKDGFDVRYADFISMSERKTQADEAVVKINALVDEKNRLKTELSKLSKQKSTAQTYAFLQQPFASFADTAHTRVRLGCVPIANKEVLINELSQMQDCGLEVYQTHGPWRYPPRDGSAEERAERFEKMSQAIYATALMGCKNFVIHPIMPWGLFEQEYQRLFDINVEFMSRLAEVGKQHDVVVCLENMPMVKYPLSPPEECLKIVRAINTPWLKICLATGHCSTLQLNPADAVRMIGKDLLSALHVRDNDGFGDRHWVPFMGAIDWDDFKNALQEIKFDGCISIETVPPKKFSGKIRMLQEKSLYCSARYLAGLEV
jgi:sugar phosphate isomerase/epimerase